MKIWCPVMQKYFEGVDCSYFKGEKCKDVNPLRCMIEMRKQREKEKKQ